MPLRHVPQGPWRGLPYPGDRAVQGLRLDTRRQPRHLVQLVPGNYRGFCGACGTPLLSRFDQTPEVYGLPLGALDDNPGIKPACHVHVASKAPWYDITDDLPQYPEGGPGLAD